MQPTLADALFMRKLAIALHAIARQVDTDRLGPVETVALVDLVIVPLAGLIGEDPAKITDLLAADGNDHAARAYMIHRAAASLDKLAVHFSARTVNPN